MANPFTSLECAIRYDNARVLTWNMLPDANYPPDFILQVENSRAGGPWEVLATGLRDVCAFVDSRKRNYNKQMNEYYRVRLMSKCTGDNWVSQVVEAGNAKVYPFSTEAQNVLKQVEKAIELSGCTGVLLKKKTWGCRCPLCTDFDNQSTVNEHCPNCFGTGIAGGFYNGITMNIIKDSITSSDGPTTHGYGQSEIVKARCIAYPWIHFGDIWCEDITNNRFYILDATPTSSYKHIPLLYTVTMSRLEMTDALYTPPADDKVLLKDVWESAVVTYTPEDLKREETHSAVMSGNPVPPPVSDWEKGLNTCL